MWTRSGPCVRKTTGCCWWMRCRPAWAAPAPCSPSSSMASCPTPAPSPRGIVNGLPMSGIMANGKCRTVLTPGTHATTFGGQPGLRCRRLRRPGDSHRPGAGTGPGEGGPISAAGLRPWAPRRLRHPGLGLMIGVTLKGGLRQLELAAKLVEADLLVLTMPTRTCCGCCPRADHPAGGAGPGAGDHAERAVQPVNQREEREISHAGLTENAGSVREDIFAVLDLADQLKYDQRHHIPHRYLEGKTPGHDLRQELHPHPGEL